MKIEASTCTVLTIEDVPRLDPVRVVVMNYEPFRGRIIIQCYDRAWTGAWGAMGCPMEEFFAKAHWDYIASNLTCGLHGMTKIAAKNSEPYLRRIIEAVQAAFKERAHTAAQAATDKPLTRCAAARDGDCSNQQCPQARDGEPHKSQRHCPLDTYSDED